MNALARLVGGCKLLMVAALLAACGVGGEGTGALTTSAAKGPIEGFGSVIVAGQRYDDSSLVALEEIEPGQPRALALSALRPGMQVELQGDGTQALQLRVAPALVGQVSSIDLAAGRLVLAGQTVQIDATPLEPTLLEGLARLADLRVGDSTQIHGHRDASGILRASHMARTSANPDTRVTGTVVSADSTSLRIGALTVDLTNAQRLPAGLQVRAGDSLVAWGRLNSRDILVAQVLQGADTATLADLGTQRLAGRVSGLQTGASFTVQGQRVDASQATLNGPVGLALAEGVWVTVEGPRRGGVLTAARVGLYADSSVPVVELAAAVTDLANGASFRMRGVPVDTSTARFQSLLPSNVSNGVRLSVQGRIDGAQIRASQVQPAPLEADTVLVSVGEISESELLQRRFKIIGLEPVFQLNSSTRYVNGDPALWGDGVRVELRSKLSNGVQTVEQLRYLDANPLVLINGLAGNVEPGPGVGEGEFDVGSTLLYWDAATQFLGSTGTAADLQTGRQVRVTARDEGGRLIAVRVDARVAAPGTVVLRGTVTDYLSAASFRIDGQRIDGTAAVFAPSDLSARLNGAYVDVEGSLVNGVLRASRISDP